MVRVPKSVKSCVIYTALCFYRVNHSENHVLVGCWAQVFGQHTRTYRSAHVELFSQNGGLIGLHFLILKLRQQKFFRSPTEKPHASALADHLILSVSRNATSKKMLSGRGRKAVLACNFHVDQWMVEGKV